MTKQLTVCGLLRAAESLCTPQAISEYHIQLAFGILCGRVLFADTYFKLSMSCFATDDEYYQSICINSVTILIGDKFFFVGHKLIEGQNDR